VPAVAIQMWRGAPSDGSLVGEVAVAVGAGSTVPVSIPFNVTSPGAHEVTLIADPADQVVEAREDNNQASARVTTAPSVDLEVLASQITLLDPPYPGADVRFAVTLRNRGTLGSPAFAVRSEVVQGGDPETVGEDSLQLAAGTATTLTIPWRVTRGGTFDFRVVLDPLGLVPEVDEGNNSASLPFLAGAPSTPNLTISYRDLQFTPEPALEGAPLDLQILLRNTGGVEAQQIVVRAFDGNPAQGGAPIATVTVPSLAAGASTPVDLRWSEVSNAADRFIHLVVDPEDAIIELDETDNAAFRRLDVLSLPGLVGAHTSLSDSWPAGDTFDGDRQLRRAASHRAEGEGLSSRGRRQRNLFDA
jgi:subtilase family serine protease